MRAHETHRHLSALIYNARQKKGFSTLKDLYREKNPGVDYQTWLHAEAGRRIPHPDSLKEIGNILGIDKEDLIIAYCKDKFSDDESHQIVESFLFKKFIDLDTLIDVKNYSQVEYTLNSQQVEEMKKDLRLRLFLLYTYDSELKTTISRLSQFFNAEKSEVKDVIDKLESLGLVEITGEEVKRVHRYTAMPKTDDALGLRRDLLLKALANNIKSNSHISNFHITLSEQSYKKILAYLYFAEANFIKLAKEDKTDRQKSRIQIAIIANKVDEGCEYDRKQ